MDNYEYFKVLVFTAQKQRTYLGKYVHILPMGDFGGSDSPHVMRDTATMEDIKAAHPNHNFEGMELVKVGMVEIRE